MTGNIDQRMDDQTDALGVSDTSITFKDHRLRILQYRHVLLYYDPETLSEFASSNPSLQSRRQADHPHIYHEAQNPITGCGLDMASMAQIG